MSGTKAGGAKAAITNRDRHGEDFYRTIGGRGGSKTGIKKGFALNRELARTAGALGGRKSRRGKAKQEYNEGATWNKPNSVGSNFTTKQTSHPCANCHVEKLVSELDDMGLCANCPGELLPTKRRSFFDALRPF